jgi:hypothetical protein
MTDLERSAVVALHRFSHAEERNGVVFVEDSPVSELMRQAVAFIERWNAELNERDACAAPDQAESVAPAALEHAAPAPQDGDTGQVVISLCLNTQDVTRIDAAAKRLGISRADWLHFAVGERLARR